MMNLTDFDCLQLLGKGGYGRVQKVRKNNGNDESKVYALKQSKLKHEDCFTQEKEILERSKHPFVVELFYTFTNEKYCFIVMEYLPGGSLWNILKGTPILSEEHASFYVKELILAIEYLHSEGIAYRDLKDSNTMLDASGHIKIIDFGLSAHLKDDVSYDYCGTIDYVAPEIVNGTGHGLAVDWWSLGILLYRMVVGTTPFKETATTSVADAILIGEYFLPENLSTDLRDLLSKLLEPNARKRLGYNGAGEIKQHAFFQNTCWDSVLHCLECPPIVPQISTSCEVAEFQSLSESSLSDAKWSILSWRQSIPNDIELQNKDILKATSNGVPPDDTYKTEVCFSDSFSLQKKKRKNRKRKRNISKSE